MDDSVRRGVDARRAQGVQVGDHNTQNMYVVLQQQFQSAADLEALHPRAAADQIRRIAPDTAAMLPARTSIDKRRPGLARLVAVLACVIGLIVAGMLVVVAVIPDLRDRLGRSGPAPPSPAVTSPRPGGRPVGGPEPFDVGLHYSPRGFLGDIDDIEVIPDPAARLVQFVYHARGDGQHEWEYKFLNGQLNPQPCKFAGVMFLDGDWGRLSGAGYDLRDRRVITWQARSVGGPVTVEFFAGGVSWVWDDQTKEKVEAAYPDSLRREVLAKESLTDAWRSFSWPITSETDDLRAVVAPFGWTIDWASNGVVAGQPRTFTVEIRNVSYERA